MESKRQLQVGELLKRNFSQVLLENGRNIYGDILVSVTKAQVTPDLSQAKIYVSVFGIEDKESVIGMLDENAHQLKQELVRRVKRHVRRIPDLAYYIDDTLDEMYRVDQLFDNLK